MKTFKPDLIVLDVRLGKYDGLEICQELKNNSDTKAIKIILQSSLLEFFVKIQGTLGIVNAGDF